MSRTTKGLIERRPMQSLSQRKKRRDIVGMLMILLSVVLLFGLFAAAYLTDSAEPGKNFCAKNAKPAGKLIIVVDQTDRFGQNISNRIRNFVGATVDGMKRGEELSLFGFSGTEAAGFPPLIQVCSPGTWVEHNKLLGNEMKVRARYREFRSVVSQKIELITGDKFNSVSPIIEMVIDDISARREYRITSVPIKLIIISDMIQNSSNIQFYDYGQKEALSQSDEGLAAAITNISGRADALELRNIDVEVYELFHDQHPVASEEVRRTWERLLAGRVKSLTWQRI